jgi:hypothetical protein
LFGAKGAITIGRCRESDDHLWEDLGKSGYKLDMEFCLKIILLYFWLHSENQPLFVCSLLAIKNLQNHFISEFRISLFGEILPAGKGLLNVHAPGVMASEIE